MIAVRHIAHQFSGAVNRNTAFDTNCFTKLTTHTFFLINNGNFKELGVIRTGLHGNTIKGTNIHAKLAGRTGFRIDFRFGNGQRLDFFNRLAFGVNNRLNRTMNAADPAVNTKCRVNVEHGFFFARNRFGGTFDFTKSAADACAENGMWHSQSFLRWGTRFLNRQHHQDN